MLNKTEKAAFTRAKNALQKWNDKYLNVSSPYVVNQYRRAQTHYHETANKLKQKYRGVNLRLEI